MPFSYALDSRHYICVMEIAEFGGGGGGWGPQPTKLELQKCTA